MEIRQIEFFLAVVEHGGIAAAARALDISQPTLSQAVKSLEREFDAPLFDRRGGQVTLTASGRALIGPASRVMRNVRTLSDPPADVEHLGGRFDLAVFPALADTVVDVLADFCERHPRVAVRVSELQRDDDPKAADIVRNGAVDAAILHLPARDDNLDVLHLGAQEYVFVHPPGIELPSGPLDAACLPDLPMIFVPEVHTLSRDVGRRMRSHGSRPRVTTLIEFRETIVPLVAAGVGGAIVDRRVAELAGDRVGLRTFGTPITRAFGIVYDASRLSAPVRAFLSVAAEHAATTDSPE